VNICPIIFFVTLDLPASLPVVKGPEARSSMAGGLTLTRLPWCPPEGRTPRPGAPSQEEDEVTITTVVTSPFAGSDLRPLYSPCREWPEPVGLLLWRCPRREIPCENIRMVPFSQRKPWDNLYLLHIGSLPILSCIFSLPQKKVKTNPLPNFNCKLPDIWKVISKSSRSKSLTGEN
jgi:hypothetical protein